MADAEREIRVDRSPSHCPYCKDTLEDPTKVVACPACGARHHDACHSEHGRCASCGEVAVLAPRRRPARNAEPPRGSRVTVAQEGETLALRYPVRPGWTIDVAAKGSTRRLVARVLAILALLLAVLSAILLVVALNVRETHVGVILFLSCATTVVVTFATLIAFLTTRTIPRPPASILLGRDEIEFPGHGGPRKAPRVELGHVRTERIQPHDGVAEYRLTIDVGVERVIVALSQGELKEPEIDWIADRIREWKDEA